MARLMTVPNHDWAKKIAEPTTQTIDSELRQDVRIPVSDIAKYRFDGAGFMLKLSPMQTAALHILIRYAIAAELEKLVHSYNTRPGGLVAPANVAYHIAEKAQEIRSWLPSWNVVTAYEDDSPEEEHAFPYLDDAVNDAGLEPPGMTKKVRMR
jgi:hypothetical protein